MRRHTTLPDKRTKLIRLAGARGASLPLPRVSGCPDETTHGGFLCQPTRCPANLVVTTQACTAVRGPASPQPTKSGLPPDQLAPRTHHGTHRADADMGHADTGQGDDGVASSRTSSTTPHEDDSLGRR